MIGYIKNKVNLVKASRKLIEETFHQSSQNQQLLLDNYGVNCLLPLLQNFPYLPFTSGAIRPIHLSVVANDILINNRKSVFELGSGTSTIVLARLIKQNSLNCKITTLEHDEMWFNKLENIIKQENLGSYIQLIHAPLKEMSSNLAQANSWYDLDYVIQKMTDKIDLLLIDGPPAYKNKVIHNRYFAIPCLIQFFQDSISIYLDDAERTGEKDIIAAWEKEFGLKFKYLTTHFAVTYKGSYINPLPVKESFLSKQ